LTYYGVLIPNSSQQYLNALWGKLAAEILIFRWEDALADINRINDVIENSVRLTSLSLSLSLSLFYLPHLTSTFLYVW
jgi:translation initiation factor 3 subunit E